MYKITTGTWLPVFPGFYCTILEWLIDSAADNDLECIKDSDRPEELKDAMKDHYYVSKAYYANIKPMETAIAKQCTTIVEKELKALGFVESIKFEKLVSPREYNFNNDSVDIEVTFTPENVQNIRHYISEHFAQWREYLKGTYTSCDGFISHHSNQPGDEEWFVDNALNDQHNAGAVLEFLCGEHEINAETLFNQCESVEGIDLDALEKQCYKEGWYIPDNLWNKLKTYRFPVRFKVIGSWAARQYVLDTKKQRYIFAVTKAEPKTDIFLHKRFFKIFLFGWLKNEKGNKA